MMQQTRRTTLPDGLQSPRAKLVYLYLSTHDAATISDMQQALDMTKLSLYSILRTLSDRQLVVREQGQYSAR